MAVCGLFLRLGISGSHKTLEQNFIFQIGTLYPHGIKFILIFLVNIFDDWGRQKWIFEGEAIFTRIKIYFAKF